MLQYDITIDLCEDYSKKIGKRMREQGIKSKNSGWDLWYDYFNLQKKRIKPLKRKVVFSKEFTCPAEVKLGLNCLVRKFEAGQSVSPHLSKDVFDPSKFDGLLYDWGIYHFHLGKKMHRKNGRINRTGPILFAKVDSKRVYCINVYSHGKGVDPPWSKQSILRILHNNWPETIQEYRIPGAISLCPDSERHLTDEQYAAMRKDHVFAIIEVADGVVYSPPGGGLTSSGHSQEIVSLCDVIWNTFKEYEIHIKENIADLVKCVEASTGKVLGNKLDLKLCVQNSKLCVVDSILMVPLIEVEI